MAEHSPDVTDVWPYREAVIEEHLLVRGSLFDDRHDSLWAKAAKPAILQLQLLEYGEPPDARAQS